MLALYCCHHLKHKKGMRFSCLFYVCENVVRGLGKFNMSLQLIKTKSLPRHWSRSQDTILTLLAHHQDTYLLPSQNVVYT